MNNYTTLVKKMSLNFITFESLSDRNHVFNYHSIDYEPGRIALIFGDVSFAVEDNTIREVRLHAWTAKENPTCEQVTAILRGSGGPYLTKSAPCNLSAGNILDLWHKKLPCFGSITCSMGLNGKHEFSYYCAERTPIYLTLDNGVIYTMAPCLYPLIPEIPQFNKGRTVMI